MASDDKKNKNNSQGDSNKVVPFPTHKIRKPGTPMPESQDKATGTNGPVNKKTLVISLLSTVLVATFISSRVNQNHDVVRTDNGRDLASVSAQRRDLDEDLMLAKKISRQSLREPASGGRQPTAEELLSHGELNSAYAIQYHDGALRSIEYANQSGTQHSRVNDPDAFIKHHQDLLKINFDGAKKSESIRDNEYLTEIYELSLGGSVVARVHFKFQNDHELQLMKVDDLKGSGRQPADAK